MAQLMQVRLQRYDAQPWGFRLQGGKDFAAPLVVQKINGGSLAEQAGLLPGDAVIKINDIDVYNLRHKEAQDLVVRSGNNFVVTVQRGGLTWRPNVTPTGQVPTPNPYSNQIPTVTKTSLAHKPQEVHHIGSGYNNSARPFNAVNGNDGQVKSIVNKQYNTPVGIYSDETIAETLSAQAEVLAGGVLGINFKKNEKQYQADKSEVLKFLHEEETGDYQEPEPKSPANFYWTHSHAIGGQRTSRPVTPSSKPQDERIGTPLQQNTLAPGAAHRPSLPTHQPQSKSDADQKQAPAPTSTTPTVDPRLIIMPVCPALQSSEYKEELEAAAAAATVATPERPPSTLTHCAICGVGIVGVFVRIKDKNLHVECFKCATCGSSLKNQGYYNFNNKLYCDIHARLAALQNPPTGTEGYAPVPIKPNTKLSASTISAALNNIGYNGNASNGTSTPSYSAPPSNPETTSVPDLPLPPPPSPTQLQQFQIQDGYCNGNNNTNNIAISNHSRTNSSLSTASSSSLSLSPYSSTNGINNNSCSPVNNIENTLNNHNGYSNSNNNNNSLSTLSLDRFASSTSSSPGHSRQQSTSSSIGSGNAIDFQFPPPPPPPLPQYNSIQQHHQQHQHLQQNSMTINQSGKQNENDMNSNNRYVTSMASSNTTNGSGAQTNGVSSATGQGSDIANGRADDSICGSINPPNGQGQGHGNEQFQYVTLHGNVIRSVIPPGKGAPVNYKVSQGYARPYGAPAPAPAAAPKSPTSYPPPTQQSNWGQQRPVQQQQQQQQPMNPYATLPRSNPAPQEIEQQRYFEYENQRTEEHRAASYFEEDHEICEANRDLRTSFNWPPPKDDSHDQPTAAPLYIAPPETQHVVPKLLQRKHVVPEEDEEEENKEQEEQQQMHWQSRSAPQLTGMTGMHVPEIGSSSDSYTSTCTTTTTTSEEYQRMYAAQAQAYQMQGYEQSGSEMDYHMDMEVAAMQQQGDQCYLSSSEYISGRRSAQECVESLAGTLDTYRLVDLVREVTPSPVHPPPKGPRHVEFADEPEFERIPREREPPKKESPPKKEEPRKREEPPKREDPPRSDDPPKRSQQPQHQETVEEPEIVKEIYQVCGGSRNEELVVEDRTQILQNQRIFQPTPEIKIEIPPVKPIPPTNIPNPVPKEWISPMVRALTTAPDTPVHMVECPCPKPCDSVCQCNPDTCRKEKAAAETKKPETEPKREPEPKPEPEPEVLRESPPKGSFITSVMTTAPDYTLQFPPNPSDPITLPEETEPYLPPPIDMKPYEREDYRPKSPFLKALITAPDTPYNPFGHEVCSQLLDLPTPTEKLTMVDALITAPDRPYTPLNPEKATQLIEEQKKAEQKKPYQFQILTDDEICDTRMSSSQSVAESKVEQRRTSTSAFANMTNQTSVQPFQPSREPLPPTTPRHSVVSVQHDSADRAEYETQRRASQRNTNMSQVSSSCCSSSKSFQQYQQQQTDEMFGDHKVSFPPPSPLSHLKPRLTQSGLHKPDTIPQYQRNWTVLPTQRPVRTPEPPELRENVPLAFVDTPPSPQPVATAGVTCSNAQQQQRHQAQSINTQHTSISTATSSTAASSSATASRTMTRVSEQKQQQQQYQQSKDQLKPIPTVPIIVEDRSGPVTMAFQSLDEHQQRDESYPPSRPYTPSLINKPAPVIPFYQTPDKLCFEECPATTGHPFDRRSVSPCPDRAKSPAPGPPPNPLSAIRAPRLKDSDLPVATPRNIQVGSITTGQSYLGAQQMQQQQQLQQQQQQGQMLSHYQTVSQTGSQSFVDKPEVVQQHQIGDRTIEKREKESRLAEEKKSQLESKTTSQIGNTQIERRRKVVEEYEHTQSAKTIEIRTGSSSTSTSAATASSAGRSSYGKTGFVANQARRLSGLEQEITNLTSQSQAISARAAALTERTFPQLHSPEPVAKFPIKPVLPSNDEPQPAKYIVSPSAAGKVASSPPAFKQQHSSTNAQSSVSQIQQQQQQQKHQQQQQQSYSAQSSSSLVAAASSGCSLTNASATTSLTNQQQSRASAIPVPAYKPPPMPTTTPSSSGRCPMTGKVCAGAGGGTGGGVCRAPCSQMQSQPSSNNNTYKPTASTGPAGFKPPQAQAPQASLQQQQQQSQQQQQQQYQLEPNTNNAYKPTVPTTSSTLPRMKPSVAKPKPDASQTSEATQMLTDSIGKVNINMNNFMAEAGKIISNMLEARLANGSKNNSNTDLTTISGVSNSNGQTRSPMVMRKRFELDDFKNVDPAAPADLKPTQVVMQAEQKFHPPLQQKPVLPVVTGDVLTQQNHHMKNLIEICDAKRVLNPVLNGNKPAVAAPVKPTIVTSIAVPIPPPQPPVQQKAQPQAPAQVPPTELAPLETVIFRNKNRSANKSGELSTHATDRRSYIERDAQPENVPVFEISVKPMGTSNTDGEAGIDETKAVVSQLLKDGKRPICCQCDKEISRGPFITALGRIWCPDHFMCVNANCRRPLQDIGFVEEKGDLYCEYCFEKYLAPTCSKCSGKIKGDCLNAIGRHFHPECFTCGHCGKLFGNTPFFLEEGMAYCEADWNELFTTKCFACGFPVEAGDRWVEALNHNYHSQCFNCTYCKKNLEGQSFYNKGGRPFCKNHAR